MQRRLILEFSKMNGSGNDFIVVDNRFYYFSHDELTDLAKRLCKRRLGVGADGLLAFMPPEDEQYDYRMKYYNADGSIGTMCGNGACCLARFAQLVGHNEPVLQFESDAGVYKVEPGLPGDRVKLYVPNPQDIRLDLAHPMEEKVSDVVHYIWTGTEHAVYFVDDLEQAAVHEEGQAVRRSDLFAPAGVNVNFVHVVSPGSQETPAQLEVRTFEKGVECETLACGTGALASAILSGATGVTTSTEVEVQMPGGTLGVGYDYDGETVSNVYLLGNVESVYRGTLEV